MNDRKIIGVIFVVTGLGAVVYGVVFWLNSSVPSNYARTTGMVTNVTPIKRTYQVCNKSGCRTYIYYTDNAVVSFSIGSQHYSFTENVGGVGNNNYHVSEIVEVAYSPSEPAKNARDTSLNLNPGVGQTFAGIGAVFFLVGVILFYSKRKGVRTVSRLGISNILLYLANSSLN